MADRIEPPSFPPLRAEDMIGPDDWAAMAALLPDRIRDDILRRVSRGDMTDCIEPALTPKQWAEGETDDGLMLINGELFDGDGMSISPSQTVALANAALPDGDRRKITRGLLFDLHEVIANFRAAYLRDDQADAFGRERLEEYVKGAEQLEALLASYLPPQPPDTP